MEQTWNSVNVKLQLFANKSVSNEVTRNTANVEVLDRRYETGTLIIHIRFKFVAYYVFVCSKFLVSSSCLSDRKPVILIIYTE